MENYYNEKYFGYQKNIGEIGGRLNLEKFAHFIRSTDTVLDFGCGGGYLLSNLNCKRKIGIEINPEARKMAENLGLNEVYENFSSVEPGLVDVVISNHALEHVEYPIDALRQIYKVLKPGGRIALALPFDDYRNAKRYDPKDINMHLYTWNQQLIGNCLKSVGFKNIKTKMYVHAWPGNVRFLFKHLPKWLFRFACFLTSVRYRRRQVIAIAEK